MSRDRLFIQTVVLLAILAQTASAAEPGGKPAPPDWQKPAIPAANNICDDVLKYWEFKIKKIQKFRCSFERWSYQPGGFGPSDPNTPYSHSVGTIRYESPDKALFHVETHHFYKAPRNAGDPPRYEPRRGEVGEHWVYDGKRIFEFRHDRKELTVFQLPSESQGKPFPSVKYSFLWFGEREVVPQIPFFADRSAQELKDRFWMRMVTPKDAKNQYWIELWPKQANDAASFKKVDVILSVIDFLPEAMQIYSPAGHERTVFQFTDRQTNDAVDRLDPPGARKFYDVELPKGWKRLGEEKAPPTTAPAAAPAKAPAVRASAGRRRDGFLARWRARRQSRR